jgi:CheY-like chemotaxis protein
MEIPYEEVIEHAPSQASKPVAAAASRAAHLLLVEDNPVNQRVVLAMLRKKGYSIDVANNGQEALEMLEQSERDFDLVLMDVQMPVLDGLETTRAIRRDSRWLRLPIVAMTAHAMNGDKERCLKAGMNGYLSKPVQAATLIATIEKHLSGASGAETVRPVAGERDCTENMVPADQAVARGVLQLFLQLAPERVRKLEGAVETRDMGALVAEARVIRVAAKQLGNYTLGDAARKLEEAAGRDDFAEIVEQFKVLRQEFDSLTAVAA